MTDRTPTRCDYSDLHPAECAHCRGHVEIGALANVDLEPPPPTSLHRIYLPAYSHRPTQEPA